MRIKSILAVSILVLSLLFSSCSQNQQTESTKQIVSSLETVNVAQFKELKNRYKDKVILVNFFASWCPPCNQETPGFVRVYNKLKDKGFIILAFSIDDNVDDAVKFVNKYGITYPVYHADRSLEAYFNVSTIPTSVFYKKGGTLYNLHVGYIDEKDLENYILDLLNK